MGNAPNTGKYFACNGTLASPGNYATFSTYGSMLEWANRAFDLGLSKAERARACCEVLPRVPLKYMLAVSADLLSLRAKVDLTDAWSPSYQYYVFSVKGAKASPVVLNFVAVGDRIL